jgi:hypothetical protein
MARREKYAQGEDAGKIIEFIMRRKNAYYEANVTRRWKEACESIKSGIEQRFTADEEDLTRAKFFLSTMVNANDGYNEVFTDAYGMAQKLFVFNTKRKGTMDLAKRAEWLMENVWEDADGTESFLSIMRDLPTFGMGVSRQQWDLRRGNALGYKQTKGPWGVMATVALQQQTLLDRAFAKRYHPYDWFGYWRQSDNLPWEGLLIEFGAAALNEMLEDTEGDYEDDGIKAAMERLKKGPAPKDEYFHGNVDGEWEDVPDDNTLQGYEYFGDLYGCPGHEKDTKEYQVILTDTELLKKVCNDIEGFRPIKRTRGIIQNDWSGGRPLLLPQVPALKMQNFFANSMIDDVADRLYAGWATWEHALVNPDEFLNPQGIGVPVRMNRDASPSNIPMRIGGGQSGIQADVQRINDTIIERDRQAGNFQDVLSQKGGIQDGTARAANLIASQGARKVKGVMINGNTTGLTPIAAQLLILTFINRSPEELAKQTRDSKPFTIGPEEWSLLLQHNLWTFSDSFRRDPYLDTESMERFAKVGGVEFMAKHAADPMIPVEFWREYASTLNMRNYDRYLPLEMPAPTPPPGGPGGLPPELAGGGAPAAGGPPEQGAEVPEAAAA